VAGLVGIIAQAPDARVHDVEVERLADCYRSLRAEPERARLSGGQLGVAVLFGAPEDLSVGARRGDGSWAGYVGSLHSYAGPVVDAPPTALDGQFALIRYREQPQRLEVLSDPFGLQSLYIASRHGLTYVSTSVLALAKHLRARPSVHGIEVWLRAGPHFAEFTNWEGIERLLPATSRSYGPGGGPSFVYWRPEVDRRVASLKLAASARHCIEAAAEALQRRFARNGDDSPSRTEAWCDLTGGYDTRLGTLLLDRAGFRFATNTNGRPDDVDPRIARRVAALAGWRWELGALEGGDWPLRCEQLLPLAVAWGDGMLEATQLAEVIALHGQRARQGAVLFNGGGGEHWRDHAWKQEVPFGGRRKRVNFERWVAVRFMSPIDLAVFRSDPTPRAREILVERGRSYAAPYEDELNSVSLDILHAYKGRAHHGAYQSAARGTLHVELPFYTKDVFTAGFSVAPRHRNSHRFARAAIALLNPRIAQVSTTSGDPAVPVRVRNAHRFVPYYTTRLQGAARKLTQNLPGPTLGALKVSTPAHIEAGRRRVLDAFITQTELDPAKMRSGPLYNAAALRGLATSSGATTTDWPTLGRIITAERALEVVDAAID
jgi:hypothetical protein